MRIQNKYFSVKILGKAFRNKSNFDFTFKITLVFFLKRIIASASCYLISMSGNLTVNVVPSPILLSTSNFPLWRRTSC